ncbi:MAG: DUF4386 domain-containing protein [Caldilineaceae bacterium]|nr:DUF4386 domain-containing protein [Caldilineaceae bacterium]
MTNQPLDISLNKTARIAGILYLTIIATGIFAEMFVRSNLIVPGDAATTAANIQASEGLYRMGIVSDMIMIMCDVAVGLAFYVLLRPVSRVLALLAAFFRLAQAATLGINLLNLLIALQLVNGAPYLNVVGSEQLQAQAMLFLNAHSAGYAIALVFFGFSILILGSLIVRSGYIPRILGFLLLFASVGYLVDSTASFLLPNYEAYATAFAVVVFVPALIGELAIALWLLVKGVDVQPRPDKSSTRADQVTRVAA